MIMPNNLFNILWKPRCFLSKKEKQLVLLNSDVNELHSIYFMVKLELYIILQVFKLKSVVLGNSHSLICLALFME